MQKRQNHWSSTKNANIASPKSVTKDAVDGKDMPKRKTEAELMADLKRVQKELEYERLKVDALNTLIDIAERDGIKIRKKSGANHRYHKYKNLVVGFIPKGPNLLWVSDITYIQLSDGRCCYLHIVTDAYSRKVIGWCLSPTLEALRQAIDQAEGYDLSQLIHHSDRGVQYCCDMYVNELNSYNVKISMTEDYKPTDNGIAERINGITKNEKLYRIPLYDSIDKARKGIGDFIKFYNEKRPHMSISYKTPSEVHRQSGEQVKAWR